MKRIQKSLIVASLVGLFAGSVDATPLPPKRQRTVTTETQTDWVLQALTKRYGNAANIPDVIIVDKQNAQATAYREGRPVLVIPVLFGESGQDTLNENQSVFGQKTTPAGYFGDIQVIFDPHVNPDMYHNRTLLAYEPYLKARESWETLTFHSILDPQKDGQLLSERNPRKHQVSNGCIRMSYENIDALLTFALKGKESFLAVAPQRKNVEGTGAPLQLMRSTVSVIILPQQDRSKANTLKLTGLEDTKPNTTPATPRP